MSLPRISPFGTVSIFPNKEALFQTYLLTLETAAVASESGAGLALTGGSTPQAFYAWAAQHSAVQADLRSAIWTVSDERMVSLNHEQSNWGNAWRSWLRDLGVDPGKAIPWPTDQNPDDAATHYASLWEAAHPGPNVYDVCTLGMGDDCHTASLFPGCPLIGEDAGRNFAATEWPGKGWRLTITPTGLERCAEIVILVTGANKVDALKQIFEEPVDESARPAQLMARFPEKVTWMLDAEAGKAFKD
ncbi:MAG: 6-phosphogluconolactonase [Opitutales bacterium]